MDEKKKKEKRRKFREQTREKKYDREKIIFSFYPREYKLIFSNKYW